MLASPLVLHDGIVKPDVVCETNDPPYLADLTYLARPARIAARWNGVVFSLFPRSSQGIVLNVQGNQFNPSGIVRAEHKIGYLFHFDFGGTCSYLAYT